ncbi:TetR/AcrR family transcriptional regulator [Actinocorallia longicatena]|uniref:TetR/AcrR family transcriptional regulator n=1 Tax=Actinocorallia longicatena TaxID=111803 RepID=A0ABP6QLZ2_9ACTN
MPKLVNHETRRRELAQALWRVVFRDGVDAVSVRSVAAEAGWSSGALRHYFPDQRELIAAAMRLVTDHIAARIQALEPEGTLEEKAVAYFEQLLPLDEARRTEAEVWFSFVTRARLEPKLASLTRAVNGELRGFISSILAQFPIDDPTAPGRMHALIDGLCLHLLLYPEAVTPADARAQVRAELSGMLR